MTAYYNEFDPYAAQWLRNLIAEDRIAPGDVDERSIADVRPADLAGYAQCHFFAGIGGWSYAARLAGWPDYRPLWTGSCPCQPFSAAGKNKGTLDERHLWPIFFKLIEARRPPVVMGEQVASAIKHGWLDGAFDDLEGINYSCGAAVIPASSTNAPHRRDRLWFIADAEWNQQSRQEPCGGADGRVGRLIEPFPWDEPWESALPRLRTLDDGFPRSVAGTDAARNAVVPQVAAEVIGAFLDTERDRLGLTSEIEWD